MEQIPIVTVQEGKLRGKIATDYRGGKYFSFQGIPYAKPPVGELRFKAPQPPEPWSGIRDAIEEGSPCYHRHVTKDFVGSEDCLFLNVYTPKLVAKERVFKAVMVWIHGGAFIWGSGNTEFYGPDFLIAENIVLVTINYRLGLLGFLSLEEPSLEVPGNGGLKDQVFALKWVQKNIKNFCGNPNNVTIFGESAGGASVHYLMMSPMAKGLFHKAIIQSATALESWVRAPRSVALIAKVLGHETVDEKTILNILKDMPIAEIIQIQEKLPYIFAPQCLNPVAPVIEKKNSKFPFLTEDPIDLITSGRFNKVPLMIGYTSKEGMFSEIFTKSKFGKRQHHNDFEILLPRIFKTQKGSHVSKEIAQTIKNFYYKDESSLQKKEPYYNLETDCLLLYSIHYTINQQIRTSSSPIYLYRVSLDSTLNICKQIGKISYPGVCHGDDLGYLFNTTLTPKIHLGSIEDDNIRKFTKLWTRFAKNGDPNLSGKDPIMNVTWKPVEKGQLHYLDIGENLTIGINPEAKRMAFWDKIFSLSPAGSKL